MPANAKAPLDNPLAVDIFAEGEAADHPTIA